MMKYLGLFSIILLSLITAVNSFEALPYVHIDFAHYFRLAQCQAKCTEKYGIVATRQLLDGTERRYFNVTNDEFIWCDRGCTHGRIFTKKQSRSAQVTAAFKDGQTFWINSATDNGTDGKSIIEAVEVLCINPAISDSVTGFVDSLTAKIAGIVKTDFVAPVRYIAQWKQMILLRGGISEETKWITASIEELPIMKVEQLQPGIFYQFMITAIGPNGRIGKGIASDWLHAPSIGSTGLQPNTPLQIKSQFNSDDGISALVSWPSIIPLPTVSPSVAAASASASTFRPSSVGTTSPLTGIKLIPSLTSCHFQVFIENGTSFNTDTFEKDESEGFLLHNLAFSSDYKIKLRTFVPGDLNLFESITTWPLETLYQSISCSQVHGKGSLECDPEPVENLSIHVNQEAASAMIEWKPAVDSSKVLLYQLVYYPIASSSSPTFKSNDRCSMEQISQYLSASTTKSTVILPTKSECKFEVKLITYDLIGREAVATKTFTFSPPVLDEIQANLAGFWIFIAPAALLILLCLIVQCARCCEKRSKKVAAMSKSRYPENV
uniref:Fibronectin type-III domain-containing protein n=1 Tax=Panagrolaimus sp. ES5 TaxID=591445 RepID=A0AC34F295_9BILA